MSQKITKTEDTLNEMNSLKSSLETLKSTEDTMKSQISSDLHTTSSQEVQQIGDVGRTISAGVKITDMPQRNATVTGSVRLSVG